MKCPKCGYEFEQVETTHGTVDRCTICKGLWFDMLEHEDLKEVADQVDTGDEEIGRAYDRVDRIDCPVCPNSRLVRMIDAGQPHIRFESCPTCFGRYYDAGEFKDVSERSLGDFIKRFSIARRE